MNRTPSRFLPAFVISTGFWLVLGALVVSLAGCGTSKADVVACVESCKPFPAVAPPIGYNATETLCRCLYVQGGR